MLRPAWGPVPACAGGGGMAPALGLLPGSRPPRPCGPPRGAGPRREGRVTWQEGLGIGGWTWRQLLKPSQTSAGRGACRSAGSVCVCVCVCTRASVSTYLATYPCIVVFAEPRGPRGRAGDALRPRPPPSPPGWAPPAPQQRPMYLRLFWMMTSVTASNTNWMLLVSVAQVKCE